MKKSPAIGFCPDSQLEEDKEFKKARTRMVFWKALSRASSCSQASRRATRSPWRSRSDTAWRRQTLRQAHAVRVVRAGPTLRLKPGI